MSFSTQALAELEQVQQHQPSTFWLERQQNPLLIQSWTELALASTAWSWMDVEPPPRLAPIWKKLWDQALTWPVADELEYVEHAVVAWSEYPVWNSVRSMKLIHVMERAKPRDWSALMLPQDFLPQRFSFHLLHAVCLHPEKFTAASLQTIWRAVLDAPNLRPDLKETLLVTMMRAPEESWKHITTGFSAEVQNGIVPKEWMDTFRDKIPHRVQWFLNFEMLQHNLGEAVIHRSVLADQWAIILNKSLWDQQAKSYEIFDFSDCTPGFF